MDFPGERTAKTNTRDWSKPVKDMPLDKGFDYFYGVPASLNYGVLAWFEGRYAKTPPLLYTAKKPNKRHLDYRIKPPYEKTPQETQIVLRKAGMEVAEDFVDNECLTRFTDKTIEWIGQHVTSKSKQQPFFVYLPFTSPHYPVCPRQEFWGQGECGGYGEFMIETDHHIGRVLKFLRETNLDDNTMIVFTSDNGPEKSWVQRIKEFAHHSNNRYRGGKRDIYEGGHRVPFLVRWPAGIKSPGREFAGLVGQTDLLSTLAEVVDVDLPDTAAEDSQSFADVLSNAKADRKRLPLINHASNGRFAITKGDWKLIMQHRNSKQELYNLRTDPHETTNVITNHPEQAKDLQQMITSIVTRGRTTPGTAQRNDTGYWNDLKWMTAEQYSAD